MSKLELPKTMDTKPVAEKPAVTPGSVTEKPAKSVVAHEDCGPFTAVEKIPSAWHIKREGDLIKAKHRNTLKIYIGTHKGFNAKLRA